MTVSVPSSSASGRTAFSRATDSGHQFDDRRGNDDFAQVDVVQAVLLGHRPHHLFAGGVAEPDQGIGQLDARLAGHLLGFGQLVRADDPLADEDLGIVALALGHAIPCETGTNPSNYLD